MGLGTAVVAAAPALAAPETGLIASYNFTEAPDGNHVPNQAEDSDFGPAIVQKNTADLWNGTGFELTGGNKNSGSWVELPGDLLKDSASATIQLEIKPHADVYDYFHFLFNIGSDSQSEYFFTSLSCNQGRTPLVGVKISGNEQLIQSGDCARQPDRWQSITAVIDGEAKTASLYQDGQRISHGSVAGGPDQIEDHTLNTIGRAPWPDPLFKGEIATARIYDEALSAEAIAQIAAEDAELVEEDLRDYAEGILAGADLTDIEVNDSYVSLPTAQGAITWSSGDPDVITDAGNVTLPAAGSDPVEVELTATVTIRGVSATKIITATVHPDTRTPEERLAALAAGYVIPPVLQSGEALPAAQSGLAVEYAATGDISIYEGAVTGQSEGTSSGSISAELTLSGTDLNVTKEFTVDVLAADESQKLLSYHRTATDEFTANNGDIAYSMHLALEQDEGWLPLNQNYGIFFPRTSIPPTDGVDVAERLHTHRSLRSPSVFYLENGDYGVVSVRTDRGTDRNDETSSSSILFVTSQDLLAYEELPNSQSIIDVGETDGVNKPYAVYDSASEQYLVGWTNDAGVPKYTTFAELSDSDSEHGDVYTGAFVTVGDVASAPGVDNYVAGREIPVTLAQAGKLEGRFGQIVNDGAKELGEITVEAGTDVADLELPDEVTLTYSDGSQGTLPVEAWDLSDLDLSQVGTFELAPKIKQTEYPMPFAEERADPVVQKWEWERGDGTHTKYLMIASNDIHGDVVWQRGNPRMPVRMADTIIELADTPNDPSGLIDNGGTNPKESIILRAGDKDANGRIITGSLWAPEFHEIDGTLSILFMPSYANNWQDGAAAIMQLKQDENGYDLDPTKPESWTVPTTVTRADGSPLAKKLGGGVGMSLDMTYFQDEQGQSYYVWQQLGAIYIAEMDPADPTKLTSEPVLVVSPEYAWDNAIAEGPNVINHEGTLFMLYSGSAVGRSYATGLATADASGASDLTDPASWEKLNYPIQKSSVVNNEWQLGTGHGMWSEDEDGQTIYVFHAYANETPGYSNYGGRDAFIRRVHWAADGMPVFDMNFADEVSESLALSLTINVVADAETPDPDPDPEVPGDSDGDGDGNGTEPGDGDGPGGTDPGDGEGDGDTGTDPSDSDGSTNAGDYLPRTGAEIATVVILALLLCLGGGVLIAMRRKAINN